MNNIQDKCLLYTSFEWNFFVFVFVFFAFSMLPSFILLNFSPFIFLNTIVFISLNKFVVVTVHIIYYY